MAIVGEPWVWVDILMGSLRITDNFHFISILSYSISFYVLASVSVSVSVTGSVSVSVSVLVSSLSHQSIASIHGTPHTHTTRQTQTHRVKYWARVPQLKTEKNSQPNQTLCSKIWFWASHSSVPALSKYVGILFCLLVFRRFFLNNEVWIAEWQELLSVWECLVNLG